MPSVPSRNLRVLQIAKHFPPDLGGIESVTEAISEMLPPQGVTADVLAVGLKARADVARPGYHVFRAAPDLIVGRNKALSWRYIRQVRALEPAYDVGLLHLPNPLGEIATLYGWRKPLVLLWHADFSLHGLRWLGDRLDARLIRKASAVIAGTRVHLSESRLASRLIPKGVAIPLPALPLLNLREAVEDKTVAHVRQWLGNRSLVIAIGRLVAYKGFDVLIAAMQQVNSSLACVIVGDGPLADRLKSSVSAALAGRVIFVGPVSQAAKTQLLHLASIGCMPSVTNQEMYGVSQVEMMAAGLPIISTKLARSGVPEVNRENITGLLVPPGDSGALAHALDRLATDEPLRSRLARGAATDHAARHSLAEVAKRYADLFRRVASGDVVDRELDA